MKTTSSWVDTLAKWGGLLYVITVIVIVLVVVGIIVYQTYINRKVRQLMDEEELKETDEFWKLVRGSNDKT